MEATFVKILNRSLVILGFCTLLLSVLAAVFAGVMLLPSLFGPQETQPIVVTYRPLSEVSGKASSGSANSSNTPASSASKEAIASCEARDTFVKRVTKNDLHIDVNKCAEGQDEHAREVFVVRAENYLDQKSKYYVALASDPQTTSKYQSSEVDEVNGYLEAIDKEFDDSFSALAHRDDERVTDANAKSILRSSTGHILMGVAAASFVAFLVIAFLLVAIRIEKHLLGVEAKMPRE